MPTNIDGIRNSEDVAFDVAEQLTAKMLRAAIDITKSVLPGDTRADHPAVLAGIVQALATNFSAIAISRTAR